MLGCFLASFFFACGSDETKVIKNLTPDIEATVNNTPNDDSELALLMRQIYVDADSIKERIIRGEGTISREFIDELERVHSAIPTDPKVKTAEFDAFNKLLIAQAKVLQITEGNKIKAFNQLVNRCVDCHKSFCPGPIKRIKKLELY